MKFLDRLLQTWRIGKARRWLPAKTRVLDIGSGDGALFEHLSDLSKHSLGIDPALPSEMVVAGIKVVAGSFPGDLGELPPFDAITMLAALEHFPDSKHAELVQGCVRYLRPGGRLIITVPSALVDPLLKVLLFLRLVDGMCVQEHHGFDAAKTASIFGPPQFRLLRHKKFQCGLNNLFVFERLP